jgi:hypothetical protein
MGDAEVGYYFDVELDTGCWMLDTGYEYWIFRYGIY